MATQEGNLLSQFVQGVSNFKPLNAVAGLIPGGQQDLNFISNATGYIPPTVSQIGQNIQKQGQTQQAGIQAHLKQEQGKPLTPQDKAAMQAGDTQAANTVVAGLTGDVNTNELPPIGDITAKNTWSPYIKASGEQGSGVIPNPDYTPGTSTPTQYTQNTTSADAITSEAGEPQLPNIQPENPPVTKPNIPQQPDLTPGQMKAFQKSGLDQYQLPASYGDKRATLEQIDKSVMANVLKANSPEDVIQKLPQGLQDVWGQVQDKAESIPSIDTEKQVIPHINAQLEKLVNQGIINNTQYEQVSNEVGSQINTKAIDPLAGTPTIDGSTLINLQKGANAKSPATIPPGSSAVAYINKAIADGYRDAIGNVDPNIRYLYNQYSSLKRIGEMSNSFRNTEGADPTFFEQVKKNPITAGAIALGAAGPVIAGAKAALPIIENAGGAIAGAIKPTENAIANAFGYSPQSNADDGKNKPQGQYSHMATSIPQDVNGHYSLPQNTGVTPLTPGTPEYTRASNALPGGAREFMVNAPQAIDSANTVQDDVKNGLPLDFMSHFKSSQDVQSYLSNPNSPYAKQLANIADLNNKFLSSYQAVNGTKPDPSQFINPGDSKEQFAEKYSEMVNFIYKNYSQFQVPYLQTTEAPAPIQNGGQNAVQYNQLPQIQNANSIVGGTPPALNFPPLPAIQ